MKEEQKKLKTKLTIIYWVNFLLMIGFALFLLSIIGINGKSNTEQDFVMERFGIIAVIAVIPLSLKFFHDRCKKIVGEEMPLFLSKLNNLYLLRLGALDFVIILNFIGFYYIGALNFMYMATIAIFVFLVCYPTSSMIDPVIENIKTNDNNDELL